MDTGTAEMPETAPHDDVATDDDASPGATGGADDSVPLDERLVSNNARRLAMAVRIFCLSQAELWQTVPLAALRAVDLDSPFLNEYHPLWLACAYGFWPIQATMDANRHFQAYVDCSSGDIVHAGLIHARHVIELAPDEIVGPLAWRRDQLTAVKVLEQIRQQAENLRRKIDERRYATLQEKLGLSGKYQEDRSQWVSNRWPPSLNF